MKYILLILLSGLLFVSCYDEDELSPSQEPENVYGKYTLPQGNHDYDAKIVDFYNKHKTLILYKFNTKDFGWAVSDDVAWHESDTLEGIRTYKFDAHPADEAYVGKQLELLDNILFNFLPDTLLGMLPQRILLCSSLYKVETGEGHTPTESEKDRLNVYSGYHHIALNWGDEKIETITPEQRNKVKKDLCKSYLNYVAAKLGIPQEFKMVTTYSGSITNKNKYEHGILKFENRTNVERDWIDYLHMAVENSMDQLEADGGLLNPSVDVKGKIRQKYTIMVNYLKNTYGFDIQAIGNYVE